jgi:hypothetical protein
LGSCGASFRSIGARELQGQAAAVETAIRGGAASAEVEARLAPVALGALVAALRLALPPEVEAAPAVPQAVDPKALSSPPRQPGRAPHDRPRGGRMNLRGQKLVALPAVHRAPGADV